MVVPSLEEVQRERVRVLGCQFRITEAHHRSIAGVLERVQLSAPRPTQTARIIQLQLGRFRQLVVQKERGEQLEIIFLKRLVTLLRVMFLLIAVALRVHFPVFATQATHDTQFTQRGSHSGIERMCVHIIDKAVVIRLIERHARSFPVRGNPRLHGRVLMRETAVIARLQLQVLREFVLVVDLCLHRTVTHMSRTVLVVVAHRHRRFRKPDGRVAVDIIIVAHPPAQREVSLQLVELRPVMVIADFTVIHVGIALTRVQTIHHIRIFRCPDCTIVIRCATLVVVTTLHRHTRDGDIILRRQMPCQSESGKEVAAAIVALTLIVLVLMGLQIFLFTQTAATTLTLTVTEVGKSIEHAT